MNGFCCYIIKFSKEGDVDKFYIGFSGDIKKRLSRHKRDSTSFKHHNVKVLEILALGWEYTGLDKLYIFSTKKEAYRKEQELIASNIDNKNYLNIELGFNTLSNHPNYDELIKGRTDVLLRYMNSLSPEERHRVFSKPGEKNGMFHRTHTPEARKKISVKLNEFYSKNDSWAKGRKLPAEQIKALSERGKLLVGEKNPFWGKTHSAETKGKIRRKRLGIKPPNEIRVSIDGVIYRSVSEAARQLGIHLTVVCWRCKSKNPKFNDWMYLKCPETKT